MTKKVLVISSNRLGDCILSSGLNNFFKNKFKDTKVFFVCGPVPGDFFKLCKNIDKLIILKKKKIFLTLALPLEANIFQLLGLYS